MRRVFILLVMSFAVGCGAKENPSDGSAGNRGADTGMPIDENDTGSESSDPVDRDGDGVFSDEDCNDEDSSLGSITADADCDGYLTAADCDDTDATINPGASDGLLADRDCIEGIEIYSLAMADYGIVAESESDRSGTAVSSAGDVDGDGLDDILVGATQNSDAGNDAGKAYLIFGSTLAEGADLSLANADFVFIGEDSFDKAGHALSSAGDVDGDGLDDILIGAPASLWGGGSHSGKAYLILGSKLVDRPSKTLHLHSANHIFVGERDNDRVGFSVSGVGDVDGDGLADVLIGASYAPGESASDAEEAPDKAGRAYLVYGSSLGGFQEFDLSNADHIFIGEQEDGMAGRAVSAAGDVDGDGLDDILIGGPLSNDGGTESGKVYVVLGSSLGVTQRIALADADYSLIGESLNDWAGYSLSGGGDVDGDGLDDILVGAPKYGSSAGAVYIVLGASLGPLSELDLSDADFSVAGSSGELAGTSVSMAGDVDADGLDDILVGAMGVDSYYNGAVYLVMSSSLGASMWTVFDFEGENRGDNAGVAVSGAGDVNGDGRADLLVGADENDDVGGDGQGGKTYVILSGL